MANNLVRVNDTDKIAELLEFYLSYSSKLMVATKFRFLNEPTAKFKAVKIDDVTQIPLVFEYLFTPVADSEISQ